MKLNVWLDVDEFLEAVSFADGLDALEIHFLDLMWFWFDGPDISMIHEHFDVDVVCDHIEQSSESI